MLLRSLNVTLSGLLVLTSVAGCNFQSPFSSGSSNPTSYGVVKIVDFNANRQIGAINFLEQIDFETGQTNLTRNLSSVAGTNLLSSGKNDEYFLVSSTGLYKTTEGGQVWRRKYVFEIKSEKASAEERNTERLAQLAQNNALNITGFIVDVTNPETLYLSGSVGKIGKVYKSTNGGDKFEEVYSEVTNDVVISNLAINPANNNQIFAVLAGNTLLRSNDSGQTWSKIRTFQNGGKILQLAFHREFGNLFYILQERSYSTSPDLGTTWNEIVMRRVTSRIGEAQPQDALSLEAGDSNRFGTFQKIIPVASKQGEFLLLADQQLWLTRDITKAWFKVNLPLQGEQNQITAVSPDPLVGADKMYLTVQNKLFTTTNTGQSWSSETLPVSTPVTKIQVDPFNNETVYLMLGKADRF
jgi:photosystem II stability/assembly factor-like uncharacterized protein